MKKIILGFGILSIILLGAWLVSSLPTKGPPTDKAETGIVLRDAHGLAVDREDSSKVYIATHTGLLVMNNDGELQRVGTAKDDYMGFSAHPTDANIFYASGHPGRGGNLGVQESTDGGKTWKKLADGVNGPVDFHTMAVGQNDPNLMYGVFRGQLQRSSDGGKTWKETSTDIGNIIVLTTDTRSKDVVYAGTTGGLYISQDQGQSWSKLDATGEEAVTAIAVNPATAQEIVAYMPGPGLLRSADGGSTWSNQTGYSGGVVMHLAYDVQNPETIYLVNQGLEIHKTTDSGQVWTKVR